MSPWPDARFQWAELQPAPLHEALPTEPWLRVAPAATAATPQLPVVRRVERHVLLQPAGRLDGVVGLLAGLTLLALPIIGAIALGSWHAAPPAPKRTVAPVVQATTTTTMSQPLAPTAPATDGSGAPMPPMGSEAATTQTADTPVATRATHAVRRRVTRRVSTPVATTGGASRHTSPVSPVHAVRHPASHVATQPTVAASTPVVAEGGGGGTVPPAQAQVTPTEQPAVVETATS